MARLKGSGVMGPVRSVRLPRSLEVWFRKRLGESGNSASELLVTLTHGGLRLCDGYMTKQYDRLAELAQNNRGSAYAAYILCLRDTFGQAYVEHLESWLTADGKLPGMTHEAVDSRIITLEQR